MQTDSLITSQKVWVLINDNYQPAFIVSKNQKQKQVECRVENSNWTVTISNKYCFSRALTNKNYNDMCGMEVLNEPQILNNLSHRYHENEIYTSIGTTLIVINPYKSLPELYSNERTLDIREKILKEQDTSNQYPHIFLTAGRAFQRLKISSKRQSIIISGESGAGKTQNTKYCMKFITALSHVHSNSEATKPIEDVILQSNPILQQFGNCKTVKNNNSSRFGKFVRLFINNNAHITGATIHNYLLQKSRVTSVAKKERTFHIFYSLTNNKHRSLAGLFEEQKFQYLESSGTMTADGINDLKNFEVLLAALNDIGLSKNNISTIFLSLGGILLLGNLQFNNRQNQVNPNVNCEYVNEDLVSRICKNLNINYSQLNSLLLQQRRAVGKDIMVKRYNKLQCQANRNTLSKALYGRIFDYLIEKINLKLFSKKQNTQSISILDIFGFQMFDHNSLQQLCINFTNERLQKLYTKYIFENEIEELKKDGLEDRIKYLTAPDNKQIIELIEKKMGISVFSMIDEKTTLGSAKDEDIVAELKKIKNKSLYVEGEPNRTTFMILHTQSPVVYDVVGFKFKNQDSITPQIESLIDNLFPLTKNNDENGKTLITKFDKQLRVLNQQLESSQLHFVRCIKPNNSKSAKQIDQKYVLEQIKYMGILETIQIRKNTFPYRMQYPSFIEHFKGLVEIDKSFNKLSAPDQCMYILKRLLPGIEKVKNSYQLGNTKIYLKQQHQMILNELLLKQYQKKEAAATKIQRQVRRYYLRSQIIYSLKFMLLKMRKLRQILQKSNIKNKLFYFKIFHKNVQKKSRQLKEQSKSIQSLKVYTTYNKLQPILLKYQVYLFFVKLKFYTKQALMYQTVVSYSTIVQQPKKQAIRLNSRQHMSALSGIQNYESVVRTYQNNDGSDVLFKGQIVIAPYDENKCDLKTLNSLISHTTGLYFQKEQPWLSIDHQYLVNIHLSMSDMKKIGNFQYIQFFNSVFRKKKTTFGRIKTVTESLLFRSDSMGGSLLVLSRNQEKKALEIFRLLIEIGSESKVTLVHDLITRVIEMLRDGSQELIDEIFVQLLKQQNSSVDFTCHKMYQMMAILLHVHQISSEMLLSGMSYLLQIYQSKKNNKHLKQNINYVFPKMLRQYNKKYTTPIKLIPDRYQLMALMSQRQISISIFFPIGQKVIICVDYYQTFDDIKQKVINIAGLNNKRFINEILTFVEVMNFSNSNVKQNPVDQNRRVWDLITEWSYSYESVKETPEKAPVQFLMIKIKHIFQLHSNDLEGIEMVYSQCYFDFFLGKFSLRRDLMQLNSAIMKTIDPNINDENLVPLSIQNSPEVHHEYIRETLKIVESLKGRTRSDLHFLYIKNCQSDALCMANSYNININTRIYLKLKKVILVEEEQNKREEISIRRIKSWDTYDNTFSLTVSEKNAPNRVISFNMRHDYARILSQNLMSNMELIQAMRKQ